MSKASQLNELVVGGFNVPPFVVIPATDDAPNIDKISSNASHFAVRSSAEVEDGESKSYAGAFHSELAVPKSEMLSAIKRVRESLPGSSKDQIIIQQFVNAEYSGVSFADFASESVTTNSLPGQCKAVVEGWPSNHFEFERDKLTQTTKGQTNEGLFFIDGELKRQSGKMDVPNGLLSTISLKALEVARYFKKPMDIEWSWANDQLYILQARPVTVSTTRIEKHALYDSANVGESFGGIIAPLTADFAQRLYARVYRDLLLQSGIPSRVVDQHHEVFDNMVALAYGRIYYRMDNWYRMMAMVPGYHRNKENLESMLSLNIRSSIDIEDYKPSLWTRMKYPFIVGWKILWFDRKMKSFKADIERLLSESEQWSIENLDLLEARSKLQGLFEGILRKWYLTVENDTMMMWLYGRLTNAGAAEVDSSVFEFHSVSVDQVLALQKLSHLICSDEILQDHLERRDRDSFFSLLESRPEIQREYTGYLKKYGGRFANELKLETSNIEDDFEKFAAMVLLYGNKEIVVKAKTKDQDRMSRKERWFKKFASRREEFRLLRANMFALVRKLALAIGRQMHASKSLDHPRDVFYLSWDELMADGVNHESVEKRKRLEQFYEKLTPPSHFSVSDGVWPDVQAELGRDKSAWKGQPASTGEAHGKAWVTKSFDVPSAFDWQILVTERTDPGWTNVMALAKGLVVEHGGILSHASIVARELGLPAVIGIEGACQMIETGDELWLNGATGELMKTE